MLGGVLLLGGIPKTLPFSVSLFLKTTLVSTVQGWGVVGFNFVVRVGLWALFLAFFFFPCVWLLCNFESLREWRTSSSWP